MSEQRQRVTSYVCDRCQVQLYAQALPGDWIEIEIRELEKEPLTCHACAACGKVVRTTLRAE